MKSVIVFIFLLSLSNKICSQEYKLEDYPIIKAESNYFKDSILLATTDKMDVYETRVHRKPLPTLGWRTSAESAVFQGELIEGLSILLGIKKTRIFTNDSINRKYVSYRFYSIDHNVVFTDLILKSFQNHFNFDIIDTNISRRVWRMTIKDSSKIQKFDATDSPDGTTYSGFDEVKGVFTLFGFPLSLLAEDLENRHKEIFIYDENNERLKMKIPKKVLDDTDLLISFLKDNYGIQLSNEIENVKITYIRFNKNKP
ncbi:MAG: hypothetical protein JNL70_25600 [Saprospiraceae bacterium]|nr:hypothetical protein [Saprospiraceae bacterium]